VAEVPRRFAGRAAIVTGGGDGIGQGIVRRLAAEGARVLLAELNPETGARAAEAAARDCGVEVVFRQVDVTARDQVEAMIADAAARFGGVDILVNNAWGGGNIKRIEHKSDSEMAHGVTMGLYAAMWAMRAAFPLMKAKGWGRVVNLCSLNGVNAHIGSAEYNVGKEALRAYSRTAAREWAGFGITCNVVCPASISAAYRAFRAANPETAAAMDGMNPMGRMGDPEADIAPVVAFLASEDSRYLTGNTLFVDGGGHINGVAWAPELPDAA
jgi:NAD(P)-dependent dehydrogenase (short-subunit alcohol dehydrogenase family)